MIADALLREREIVVGRLRRLGVQIVDAPVEQMGTGVCSTPISTSSGASRL